jgi:hypothetical protein
VLGGRLEAELGTVLAEGHLAREGLADPGEEPAPGEEARRPGHEVREHEVANAGLARDLGGLD